ncbi:CopG family transcriptional regulator [Sphingomonas agri]|uniref:CopG family transcriptional regulator n=1 Tax=Sphingomonas agri TaxID=1813878 RepID=UPI00311F3500
MSEPENIRFRITVPSELLQRLEGVIGRGASKSSVVATAISAWIDRKGDDELELRFARRLDRQSAQLGRIERIANIDLESLALFIQYMLTINAPIADEDEAARALGRDRFRAFTQRVARQLATGRRRSLDPEGEE